VIPEADGSRFAEELIKITATAGIFHDREGFTTFPDIKPFAIMELKSAGWGAYYERNYLGSPGRM
jgi:hypothetical protein